MGLQGLVGETLETEYGRQKEVLAESMQTYNGQEQTKQLFLAILKREQRVQQEKMNLAKLLQNRKQLLEDKVDNRGNDGQIPNKDGIEALKLSVFNAEERYY